MSDEMAVYAFPGRIMREGDTRALSTQSELLALAKNTHAYDPSVFDEHPPVFFRVEISSDRVDAYFTHMLPSTLRNFSQAAATGVAVLVGHNHRGLPFGRSLTGTYKDGRKTGVKSVESDFFTIPGINLNGQPTDDLIIAMRSGIVTDASVGFFGGKMLCNICGRDMLRDWDCWHIPGFHYDPTKPDAHAIVEEGQLCLAGVDGAGLGEYSMVYDGGTPGAGLIKALREVESGRVAAPHVRQLESMYRQRMPDRTLVFPVRSVATTAGVSPLPASVTAEEGGETRGTGERETQGDMRMPPHEGPGSGTAAGGQPAPEETGVTARAALVGALRAAGFPVPDGEATDNLRIASAILGTVRTLQDEIARLRPLADDGTRARSDLIEQTLLAGERALAEGFAREEWADRLARWTLDDVIAQRRSWLHMGDRYFGGGGRSTVETIPAPPPQTAPGLSHPHPARGAFTMDDLERAAPSSGRTRR